MRAWESRLGVLRRRLVCHSAPVGNAVHMDITYINVHVSRLIMYDAVRKEECGVNEARIPHGCREPHASQRARLVGGPRLAGAAPSASCA